MSNRIRSSLALGCALLLLSSAFATHAAAQTRSQDDAANAPVAVDVLLLRPVGFLGLVVGTGLFLVSVPIVAITRPHEIGRPFNQLVGRPAKFLWRDPLGGH
jgi:hypothetical protein